MALRIRLRRMGRKNAPTYRIVVAESSAPRDGRIVELLGHYNPRTDPLTLSVNRDRALHWIDKGATPTDTVKALLKRAGVFRPEAPAEVTAAGAVAAAVKERAGQAAETVKAAAAKVREVAKDVADEVAEETREAVEDAVEKVKDLAEDAREVVREVVEEVREAADEVKDAVEDVAEAVARRNDDTAKQE